MRLPAALATTGLIDEYTFVVYPVIAGRCPRLVDGLELTLELANRREFRSGPPPEGVDPVMLPGTCTSSRYARATGS